MIHQVKHPHPTKPKLAVAKCGLTVPKVETTAWASEVTCPDCKVPPPA